MKLKNTASIITFSIIVTTMTQASIQHKMTEVESTSYCNDTVSTNYKEMTTTELQIEVEKQSKNENVSFTLGKELIKRWTKQ